MSNWIDPDDAPDLSTPEWREKLARTPVVQGTGMQPAATIIQRLGGMAQVAKLTGTAYTAPYRWTYPRDRRGTGGTIPQKYHRLLLDYATANGIGLKAEDFLPAREEKDVPW